MPDPTLRVFENEVNGDPGWTLASITRTTDAGTDELSGNNIGTTFGNPVICVIDFTHGCVLIFHNVRGNTPPQHAAKLAFTVQPNSGTVGQAISPAAQVEIQDSAGARVANANGAVTLALGANPGGGVLAGTTTVNAVNGVATFSGLSLDRAGGYTLVASSGGLASATSATFTVAAASGGFAQIVSGAGHACGLTVAGVAYCWGYNDFFGVGGPPVLPQTAFSARCTCGAT